jgi:hypothetical protein
LPPNWSLLKNPKNNREYITLASSNSYDQSISTTGGLSALTYLLGDQLNIHTPLIRSKSSDGDVSTKVYITVDTLNFLKIYWTTDTHRQRQSRT